VKSAKIGIYGLLSTLAAFSAAQAQSYSLQWAKHYGTPNGEGIYLVATDQWSNVFAAGFFTGTLDFDPGPGTFCVTSQGQIETFITKFDAAGNFLWAGTIPGNASPYDICTDGSGNVLLCGTFQSTVDFDPGPGIYALTSPTNVPSGFVLKLNNAGSFIHANVIDIGNAGGAYSIRTDQSNNIYVGGTFSGLCDFNPGPGTFSMQSQGPGDGFIAKLNSAGIFQMALQFSSQFTSFVRADILDVDVTGNLYLGGEFYNKVDVDPGPGTQLFSTTGPGTKQFIGRFSPTGSPQWVSKLGSATSSVYCYLEVLASGSLCCTGYFKGVSDLDPGLGSYTVDPQNWQHGYVSYLDPATGNLLQLQQFSGNGNVIPDGIHEGANSNIFVTGNFDSALIDLDPGAGTYTLDPQVPGGHFITSLDQGLNFKWALNMSVPMYGHKFALGTTEEIFIGGSFNTPTLNVAPGSGSSTLSSAGNADAFLLKLSPCNDIPFKTPDSPHFCEGSSISLTVSATGSVSWYSSQTSTLSLASGSAFVTPTLSAGNYSYYAASSNCTVNGARLPVQIVVNASPSVSISVSAATVCLGSILTLSAAGAHEYSVNTSSVSMPVTFTPLGMVSINVTGMDSITGCKSVKSLSVAGLECVPVAKILGSDEFSVFPNPASTKLFLRSGKEGVVELRDITGQLLRSFDINRGVNAIDISDIVSGIFLITNKNITLRIIKE
jgi:hypothetical protein